MRTDKHTLKIIAVRQMFREAGIPRSERSILRWCQPDQHGGRRLDGVKDKNDGCYYITLESVEEVIEEERAKLAGKESLLQHDEVLGTPTPSSDDSASVTGDEREKFENRIRDLEITNAAKDLHIKNVIEERENMFNELIKASGKVGQLEEKLLRLDSGSPDTGDTAA